jgi:hypothetical protein
MSSKKIIISVLSIFLVGGCASGPEWTQISEKDIKPMTYDYNIPNTNKDVLFKRARNHFATVYGDSRSVIRVQDEAEGLIIGKGAIDWKLGTDTLAPISCSSSYNIRFIAKDNKARLQIHLIEGAPVFSQCTGWRLPTVTAYQEILKSFNDISAGVESSLKGLSDESSFKDF